MNHYVDILGGRKNLEMAVAVFYKMALLDPVISPYFRNKNTDQIASHFCNVVEACLGEERTQSRSFFTSLTKAHGQLVKEFGLNDEKYDHMLRILDAALDEVKIPADLKAEMMDLAEFFRTAVLGR